MTNEKFNNYDVFRSFLVENADYEGYFELPVIRTSSLYPKKLVSVSKEWQEYETILTAGLGWR